MTQAHTTDIEMTEHKYHPIIFSGPMVRAILDGRKTMTRRVFSFQNTLLNGSGWSRKVCGKPRDWNDWGWDKAWVDPGRSVAGNPGPYLKVEYLADGDETVHRIYPKWQPGDRIWVQESWFMVCHDADDFCYCEVSDNTNPAHELQYMATHPEKRPADYDDESAREYGVRWRPPIYMHRWASRITLEVTAVRIERVWEISEEDSLAEGVDRIKSKVPMHRDAFYLTWTSLHGDTGPKSWEVNPWVAVIEFERVER